MMFILNIIEICQLVQSLLRGGRGHAIAQAVSCRALTAKARVHTRVSPCGICGGQSGTGTGFSQNSLVFLSISFYHGSPYSYISWGMNNRRVGGRSSETSPHPIDMSKGRETYNSKII
jgi:hypothetical protein